VVRDVGQFAKGSDPKLAFNMTESRGGNELAISLSLAPEVVPGGTVATALKLETRARRAAGPSPEEAREAFLTLNDVVNDVFFGLFRQDELVRFARRSS